MRNIIKIILFVLLIATSGLMSSCQEENIQPSSEPLKNKDGNIAGVDDWVG